MLTVTNLTKQFGEFEAVHNVSFSIAPGEVMALIGPNGSGKSTTVKMITGLLQATTGSVTIDGKNIATNPIAAKQQLGYIPDDPYVWSGMTGEEFLHFTGALYGMDEQARQKSINPLLKSFSLESIAQTYFEDYSRGNKQKFTIIAALMHEPRVLVVDEPIVGLDPTSVEIAKDLFRAHAAKGNAVLLITHTLSVAEELATRVGVLLYSKLVAQGTIPELRTNAKLEKTASLADIYTHYTS